MMGKLWIMLPLMLPFVLFSQTDSEKRIRIGEVQQNYELFFRGDATEETADKALERALSVLQQEIDIYADTAKGVMVKQSAVPENIGVVEMKRGDRFRAFIYVKKADVVVPVSASPSAEAATVIASASVAAAPAPTIVETPAAAAPVAAAPAPTVTETPAPAPAVAAEPAPATQEAPAVEPQKKESALEEIKRVKTLSELRPLLVRRKESGDVLDYNRFSALTDATMYYVVVFSREGDVIAVLSPGREERVNLKTGREENLSQYKGYGAIAVLLSKNH